jgi:uncharacterized cupredoxin-like copper-binding protein
LGEICDLEPGKTGALTRDLTAGSYVVRCNEPAHDKDGMFVKLTVTP